MYIIFYHTTGNQISMSMADFSQFGIDELNQIRQLRAIIEFSYSKDIKKCATEMLMERFGVSFDDIWLKYIYQLMFDKLNDYLKNKFPSVVIPKIIEYAEYPDYSRGYALDDIAETFNVLDDIGIMYAKMIYDHCAHREEYFLTEKTYCSFGNITPRLSIILGNQNSEPKYIHEAPGEYLLYCNDYLYLLKDKIDLNQYEN